MIGLVSANQKTGKDKGGGLLFCALQILSQTLPSRLRVRRSEADNKGALLVGSLLWLADTTRSFRCTELVIWDLSLWVTIAYFPVVMVLVTFIYHAIAIAAGYSIVIYVSL